MKKIVICIILFIGVAFLVSEASKSNDEKKALKGLSDEPSFMQNGDLFLRGGECSQEQLDMIVNTSIGTIIKVVDEQRLIDNDFVGYKMQKGNLIYGYEDSNNIPDTTSHTRNFVVKSSSGKYYSYYLLSQDITKKLLK